MMTTILQINRDELKEVLNEVMTAALANVQPVSPEPLPDRIDDINEAARVARMSTSKLYKLTASGEFPCMKFGPRKLVFSRKAITEWMEGQTTVLSEGRGLKSITEAARRRVHAHKA